MSDTLLSLAGVHTAIAQYQILHGVDLEVPDGGLTVLLGRNGAGKTTTLRTIMGLWRAGQGRITFAGEDITARPTPDIAQSGIAYVPEDMGIFGALTVRENMLLAARAGVMADDRLGWIFELFPAIEKFWDLPAAALSGGQKQMLAISRAIIEPRRLILIDEPTKGLAPAIVDAMMAAFAELKKSCTILLVEQNFRFARNLAEQAAIIDDGRIVHAGPMSELAADTAMQQNFLGLGIDDAAPATEAEQ